MSVALSTPAANVVTAAPSARPAAASTVALTSEAGTSAEAFGR